MSNPNEDSFHAPNPDLNVNPTYTYIYIYIYIYNSFREGKRNCG